LIYFINKISNLLALSRHLLHLSTKPRLC